MARKAVVDAVRDYLTANWTACPVVEANTTSRAPADGSSFIVLTFPVTNSDQLTFGAPGANYWRDEGAFRLLINVPRDSGADQALEWADALADLFRGKRIGGVLMTAAPSAPALDDRNDDGKFWSVSIAVPYDHDLIG